MKSTTTLLLALIAVWIAAACNVEKVEPGVEVTVRDSAGIAIVENRGDTARAREGWELASSPSLIVGGAGAKESQQLYRVRGGRRLADGRFVIADRGGAQIRVYGADGSLQRTFGRKGEGPGEFQSPSVAGLVGQDTIVVYDSDLRRVSVVHTDEGFVRSYQVGSEGGGFPIAIGVLEDGGLAVGGGMFFSSSTGFPNGAVRPNSRYVLLTPDGSIRRDLGEIPAAQMFAQSKEGSVRITRLPFGRSTVAAASTDRLWLGVGDTWEIRAYDADARLTRIVRFERRLPPLSDDLWKAQLEEQLASAEDENAKREMRERYAAMPRPAVLPPYESMTVDALDYVWIGEYQRPGEEVRTYTIVDPEGRGVGRLTLPPRTRPLDIGEDFILAVTLDDLDIERLTLWDLTRPMRLPVANRAGEGTPARQQHHPQRSSGSTLARPRPFA